jgi:hypothetical protein
VISASSIQAQYAAWKHAAQRVALLTTADNRST